MTAPLSASVSSTSTLFFPAVTVTVPAGASSASVRTRTFTWPRLPCLTFLPSRRALVTDSTGSTTSGSSGTVTASDVAEPSSWPSFVAVTSAASSVPRSSSVTTYVASVAPSIASPSRSHW